MYFYNMTLNKIIDKGVMKLATPVIAESRKHYEQYIEENGFNPVHFHYITGSENGLRGRRGMILMLGRWWRNPNYKNEGFAQTLSFYRKSQMCSLVCVNTVYYD